MYRSKALFIAIVCLAAPLFWVMAHAQAPAPAQGQTVQSPFGPWNNVGIMQLIRRGAPPPGAAGPGGPGGPPGGDAARGGGFPAFTIPPQMATLAGPDGPAPTRDLSGIWDAAFGGVGARGSQQPPAPLTAWGEAVGKTHKSGDGARMVPATEINDPLSTQGDPGGYPRQLLFELRPVQFVQTPNSVIGLFMWERRWRTIWTDGRQLPTDPDPRWYGYSIGRWIDDATFVVNSNGTDERTWLDNAGNPHSDQMRVEERWHLLSRNRLELTVTLDDPKTYTRPWVALDKLQMIRLPANTDLIEMMNSATEAKAVVEAFKKEAEAGR